MNRWEKTAGLIRVIRISTGKRKTMIARTRMKTRTRTLGSGGENRLITNPHLHVLRET